MANDILVQQPNGEWAIIAATDVGGGVLVPQIGGISGLFNVGYPAGSFQAMFEGVVASAAIPAIDILYLYKFTVYQPITVNSITERLQTVGAGSSIKCAVWANDPLTARPTGLPVLGTNAGFDTSAGTGTKSPPAAVPDVVLGAGPWWGGTVTTGTPPAMVAAAATMSYGLPVATLADAIPGPAIMVTGWNTPMPFATDIMTVDLTSAVFTRSSTGVPIIVLGLA